MSKQTQHAKNVFERLAELDRAESEVTVSALQADPVDRTTTDETATAQSESGDMAAEATGDGTSEDNETREERPSGRLRRSVLTLLVGLFVVAAVATPAYLGWRLKQVDDTAAAGRAALEAARNYAVILTTVDAKDIDSNYKQALDGATGEFKDEYSQGSAQLRQILIDNKARGKGIVVDAAVKSATTTKVEVLLFADQSITNAVNPSPRIDRNRVQMTMELVDNRWLASKVEII